MITEINVYNLRIALGLSAAQLAVVLDVHPATIGRWEVRGPRRGPAATMLHALRVASSGTGATIVPAFVAWAFGPAEVDGRIDGRAMSTELQRRRAAMWAAVFASAVDGVRRELYEAARVEADA